MTEATPTTFSNEPDVERVRCPRCGQKKLVVEKRADGKFYRSTHGFDPDGSLVCRGSKKPLRGAYGR